MHTVITTAVKRNNVEVVFIILCNHNVHLQGQLEKHCTRSICSVDKRLAFVPTCCRIETDEDSHGMNDVSVQYSKMLRELLLYS